MRMIAFGFDEYAHLQQLVGKILRELSEMPAEVTSPQIVFGWTRGNLGVGVNTGDKTNVRKVHYSFTPNGISVNEWATMALREVENHLLLNTRFVLQELTGGNLNDKYFILPLERI